MLLENLQYVMGLAPAMSVRGKVVSSAQHNLPHLVMSHYTFDYGKASSWKSKRWAFFPKIHALDSGKGPFVVVIVTIGTRTHARHKPGCTIRDLGQCHGLKELELVQKDQGRLQVWTTRAMH